MITEIIAVKDKVERVLKFSPETRSCDKKLILEYFKNEIFAVQSTSERDNLISTVKWFIEMMPSFESITRARRAVQKLRPDLQAVEEVVATRKQEEEFVRDFFIGKGC